MAYAAGATGECYHGSVSKEPKSCAYAGIAALAAILLLAGPGLALEAKIKARTPLCREPQANCQPLFYLTPADAIQVEAQSADGKWYKLRHLASGQQGWVSAETLSLRSPNRLAAGKVRQLGSAPLALVSSPEGLALLEPARLVPDQGAALPLQGLGGMDPASLRTLYTPARELLVYGLVEVDKQRFLQEVQPALKPQPRFRTLLRLNQGPCAVARLDDGTLLVLGDGNGAWGEGQLVGLDAQYLPVLLLRQSAEILGYLPESARQNLRGESVRLLDLEADGTVVLSAFNAALRRDVLIRLRPRLGTNWDFGGIYFWPKQLPFRPDAPGLRLRLWHSGDQSFLLTSSDTSGPGFLAYFAGGNEALTLQRLEQPVRDAIILNNQLWTLGQKDLTSWQPVSDPEQP